MPDSVLPIVAIGGVGGSGTRLIAEIAQKLGVYMGSDLNESMDNLLFTLLFKRVELWPIEKNLNEIQDAIKIFVQYMQGSKVLGKNDIRYIYSLTNDRIQHNSEWLNARVDHLLSNQCKYTPQNVWGWKEPNSHIFLPEIIKLLPKLKYIHVIRHGLDMAYSNNQNQVKLWGKKVFSDEFNSSLPQSSFKYWAWTHKRLVEIATKPNNGILIINFEKFCSSPRDGIDKIARFLEIQMPSSRIEILANEIKSPETENRYQQLLDFKLELSDIRLLESFGYQYTIENLN